MPKSKGFDFVLRIYPGHRNLDPIAVLKTLGLDSPIPQVSAVAHSEDAEMVEVRFRDEPAFDEKELREWQTPEFKKCSELACAGSTFGV